MRSSDASPVPAPPPGAPPVADRPRLHRGLRMLGTLMITLSAITPASSVFIIAPGVIGQAGTGAVLSYAAAAVVGIFMAFVYAELSSAYPLTGGEYSIVARTLGRLPGFMIMGLIIVTMIFILAVIALGVGIYLGAAIEGLHPPTVAAITVVASTAIAILGIRFNAWVTGVFLAVEMLALVLVAGLGFINIERPVWELVTSPVNLDASGVLVPATFAVIGAATAVAIFSYNGYGSAVYFGEETRDARSSIARAILWALGITVASEMIPIVAVLVGAPSLPDLLAADNMMSYFLTSVGGSTLNTIISLAIAVAIINAVIAIMLLTARLLFSTGRDHVWSHGINRALRSVHPRLGTPWVATLVAGVLSAAACFLNERFLLVATGTALVVIYAALCLAVIYGRSRGSTAHGSYRMPLYPVPPVVALVALGYVLYLNAKDPELGQPSLLVTGIALVLSAGYYLLVVRRRGLWHLEMPDNE